MNHHELCNMTWRRHAPDFRSDLINAALATSPWSGHRRFAYDLVSFVKPSRIVELGTHYGCSLFAFLQAISDQSIAAECCAIDTWTGDAHAGFYGEEVFEIVNRTISAHFAQQRIRLIRKTFDDALGDIADASVDILHIDGLHTLEAVRHDFETWTPKLARDAIVLFHDVAPSSGYGSALYWAELKRQFPSFEFPHHSWGLGVLFPRGDAWFRRISTTLPEGWQELYRYQANSELLGVQLTAAEALARQRWDIMQAMDQQIRDRDQTIAVQARDLDAQRTAYEAAERLACERFDAAREMEPQLQGREEWLTRALRAVRLVAETRLDTIRAQDQSIQARNHEIMNLRSDLDRRSDAWAKAEQGRVSAIGQMTRLLGAEQAIDALSREHGQTAPFEDLAFALYCFCARLMQAVVERGIVDLLFCAREGHMLKEMFDTYLRLVPQAPRVNTHYLLVSRRATFLPSLGAIDGEAFDVLFRQYRRMSLGAFLKSLALDDHIADLSRAMALDLAVFDEVREDLPTDPLFAALVALPEFRALYERERASRRAALGHYIASFTAGELPDTLHVVDVGWKGSIQDNLFNWFERVRGEGARVCGYYIGLVGAGGLRDRNEKSGLLFSNQAGLTPGFRIFNENRSLFEVFLPAQHGAARSYVMSTNQVASVTREPFDDQAMIEARVVPVAERIKTKFRIIADVMAQAMLTDRELLSLACRRHRRMVLDPSAEEIALITALTHEENFGAFGRSGFGNSAPPSLIDRLSFMTHLLKRRRPSEIGFWPYLTLRQRAVFGADRLYRAFRIGQERLQGL